MNQQETKLLDLLLRNAKKCAEHVQPCSGQVMGWLNCHQTLVTSAGLRESMGVPETDFGNTEEGDTFTGTTKEVPGDCPISVLTLKEVAPPKRGRKSRAAEVTPVLRTEGSGWEIISEKEPEIVRVENPNEISPVEVQEAVTAAAVRESIASGIQEAVQSDLNKVFEGAVESAKADAQQPEEEPNPEPTAQTLSEIYNQLKKKYAGDPVTWKTISDKLVAARDSFGAATLSLVKKENLPDLFAQFTKIAAESPAL